MIFFNIAEIIKPKATKFNSPYPNRVGAYANSKKGSPSKESLLAALSYFFKGNSTSRLKTLPAAESDTLPPYFSATRFMLITP